MKWKQVLYSLLQKTFCTRKEIDNTYYLICFIKYVFDETRENHCNKFMQFQNVDIRMRNSKYDKKHKLSFTYMKVQIPLNNISRHI